MTRNDERRADLQVHVEARTQRHSRHRPGTRRRLAVGRYRDGLRLWAEVDPDDPTPSKFYAAITGQSPPPDSEFIGTAVGPVYVSHVYRQLTKP